MNNKDEYYSRVLKIVGDKLFNKKVTAFNIPWVCKALELLCCCGSVRIGFMEIKYEFMHKFIDGFIRGLKEHNGFEDRWDFFIEDHGSKEDLVIAGGSLESCLKAYEYGQLKKVITILGIITDNGCSLASVVKPGEEFPWKDLDLKSEQTFSHYFDWIDLNNQMANLAKAILLEGTSWSRPDIMEFLNSGRTTLFSAHPSWPWTNLYLNLNDLAGNDWLKDILKRTPKSDEKPVDLQGKKVMIVGLGSLGSIVADHFRLLGASIIGVDGKDVSLYNPVRQLYSTNYIGKKKAKAIVKELADREEGMEISTHKDGIIAAGPCRRFFAGRIIEVDDSIFGQIEFEKLIEQFEPDLILLLTAHPAEYRMANVSRKRNIPHIIGRCYGRARYFDITCVNGGVGPCFGCFQGHLYKGVPPELTEEAARYETSSPAQRRVDAEPATRVETGRCADVAARCGMEFLRKPEKRSTWFSELLKEERNCLLGGNCVERTKDGEFAFGIETPGSVTLYGVENFMGSENEDFKACQYCRKCYEVKLHSKSNKQGEEFEECLQQKIFF